MKVLAVAFAGLLFFLAAFFWPSLHNDWGYWTKKREYRRLQIGDTKAHVRSLFGKPADALYSDACWTEDVARWPGATRVYTLCFARGKLASKTFDDQ